MNSFFLRAHDASERVQSDEPGATPSSDDPLLASLEKAKSAIHDALCDSFNTPVAMQTLADLVSEVNSSSSVSDSTLVTISSYITRMVTVFGLDGKANEGVFTDDSRITWSGIHIPEPAQPYVYPAASLRDSVRQQARSSSLDYENISKLAEETKPMQETASDESRPYKEVLDQFRTSVKDLAEKKAPGKDLLALCDQLRDTHLWRLGIYLEDRDSQPALVRPLSRDMVAARAEHENAAAAKQKAKEARLEAEAEKKRALDEKAKQSHLEMYKTAEYSEWDADGLPTKEADGKEVAKSKRKKLVKEWERQKKLHDGWLKNNAGQS